jgi:hypothetical protein
MTKQQRQVLDRLKLGPLTDSEARDELGINRLGARIWDLRKMSYNIESELIAVRNRDGDTCHVARYTLRPGFFLEG